MNEQSSTDALLERHFRNNPNAGHSYHNDPQYYTQVNIAQAVLNAVESRMASSGIRRPYIDDTISHVIDRLFNDQAAREAIIATTGGSELIAPAT